MTITMNTAGMTANRRYRFAREAAGLRQDELAQRIGVARTTIGDWERGATEPGKCRRSMLSMPEKPTPSRSEKRKEWDARYRDRNRERRRAYDRERLRRLRAQADES